MCIRDSTTTLNDITETSSHSGLVIGNTSMGNGGLAIINSTTGAGRIYFGDSVGGNAARNRGQIVYYHSSDHMHFATAGSERLRITSGGTVNIGGDYTNTTGKLKVTGVVTIDGGLNLTAGTMTAPGGFSISSGNVIISGDIAHDADSDTKFGFSSGADTFRIDTAGSRRIYVDSSGRTNISKNGYTGSDMTFGLTVHTGSTSETGPVPDGIMIVSQQNLSLIHI